MVNFGPSIFRSAHQLMPLVVILLALAWISPSPAESEHTRTLKFYNTHIHERVTVMYKKDGHYISEALEKIAYIVRDHRTGEIHPIDVKLLDFLYDLLAEVGNQGEVHIISGYRSPATNQLLRKRSNGVAKSSLHMQGKALDFRLPGTDTKFLRDTAKAMKRGGVGFYKKTDFIQIDTSRVRSW